MKMRTYLIANMLELLFVAAAPAPWLLGYGVGVCILAGFNLIMCMFVGAHVLTHRPLPETLQLHEYIFNRRYIDFGFDTLMLFILALRYNSGDGLLLAVYAKAFGLITAQLVLSIMQVAIHMGLYKHENN